MGGLESAGGGEDIFGGLISVEGLDRELGINSFKSRVNSVHLLMKLAQNARPNPKQCCRGSLVVRGPKTWEDGTLIFRPVCRYDVNEAKVYLCCLAGKAEFW